MGGPVVGLGITAVCFWGLICAAMSTIDSYVMTASQSLFIDVVARPGNPLLTEISMADESGNALRQARAYTIAIPFLVIGLAFLFSFTSDIYALIYFAFSFMFALLPALFVGLKGWASPEAAPACERSLAAGGITAIAGFSFIILGLERALSANNPTSITLWYQAVYWWSTAVAAIGGLVLCIFWPRKTGEDESRG